MNSRSRAQAKCELALQGKIRNALARFPHASMRRLLSLLVILASASPMLAAFRAGIAVRIVTPDPLLPVSGGIGPSHPVREKQG